VEVKPKVFTTPKPGPTVFTDASSSTHLAIVVWQASSRWEKVTYKDPSASVQWLEAKAVATACKTFPDQHVNIVLDSLYVTRLVQSMAAPGIAHSPIATMIQEALDQRGPSVSILHVNSHMAYKGFFQEGNDQADRAAKAMWSLSSAQELHACLHISAKALVKNCNIPLSDAKLVVAGCPYCQK
ncbi:PO113 protein, partial [Urocolius indicus]|nr:PO113 protein [Urocolius indicus]